MADRFDPKDPFKHRVTGGAPCRDEIGLARSTALCASDPLEVDRCFLDIRAAPPMIEADEQLRRRLNRPGFSGGSYSWEGAIMSKTRNKFSPEVRERAVRMVGEHRADYGSEWAAMTSIAAKIGCTAETLRRWCREEASRRTGPAALAANDRDRLKVLEREVKELRRVNEILRRASAYFAQAELDRQGKW